MVDEADITALLEEDRFTGDQQVSEVLRSLAADYLAMKMQVVRCTEVIRAMKLKCVLMEEIATTCQKVIVSGRDLQLDSFLFLAQGDSLIRYLLHESIFLLKSLSSVFFARKLREQKVMAKFKPGFVRSLNKARRDEGTREKDFLSSELISHNLSDAIKQLSLIHI